MFSTYPATAKRFSRAYRPRTTQSRSRFHQRARLCLELLEDRMTPSAHLFDPQPSIDDLFAPDPSLAVEPNLPTHESGDLIRQLPWANNTLGTMNLSLNLPSAESSSQGFVAAKTSLESPGDPQFLPAFHARAVSQVLPGPLGVLGGGGLPTQDSPNFVGYNVILTGPADVPVNADNDNGSKVTNGIPAQRDFNVQPLANADPDLQQATVTAAGAPAGGTWTEHLTQNGVGQIALWTDAKKSAAFTVPGGLTATFYIEGTHESGKAGDVTLWFSYTVNGVSYPSNTLTITVTPLITAFTVTPAGGANGQNIIFRNGVDGSGGLSARPQPNVAGNTYSSTATQTGLRAGQNGGYKYVQNFLGVVNGNNGTHLFNGAAVGWLNLNQNTGAVLQLQNPINLANGGYPILDKVNAGGDQSYDSDFVPTPSADGTTVTITATDSPRTGVPVINGVNWGPTGIAVDALYQPRTYVAWEWTGLGGGNQAPVFYFLAYYNWQANFYGTASTGNPPIDTINVLHGVTADANYTRSNADPPTTAMDPNRIWNDQIQWVQD